MECSTLVDNFLKADKENRLTAVVAGKRKREVYLVVPAEITGRTKKRNIATILYRELEKKKEKYSGNLNLIVLNIREPSLIINTICIRVSGQGAFFL